jgi:hypothetical protein
MLFSILATPLVARAAEKDQSQESSLPRLGQAAGEPQIRSAPPSVPFGTNPNTSKDNVLDFHGYLLLPMRVGVMNRENPTDEQSDVTLHSPPLVPQNLRRFNYLGVVPDPWIQLNFSYGNATVSGTAIIAARGTSDGNGFYNPVDQLGVSDAFLTMNVGRMLRFPGQVRSEPTLIVTTKDGKTPAPSAVKAAWLELKVGAMTGRYGVMGAFDAGRYGTPLMFRTNSVGLSVLSGMQFGSTAFVLEGAFGGQVARPPRGLMPEAWNDFASDQVGASFVTQLHAGIVQSKLLHVGLHYATAWSQDDQIPSGIVPDGRISTLGADVRLTAGRFGHLYAGFAKTGASRAAAVSGVIELLNARGGPELIREYLGPNSGGNGGLTTFGAQYDLSVARLVYDRDFEGQSPDLLFSVFGIGTQVDSDDKDYDGIKKLKLGTQLTYNVASWFGVGGRFDHVRPNMDDSANAFNVISPRIMFHTDWQSRDEIALQYSHFIYGKNVVVERGYPLAEDPTAVADRNVFVLSGTFWW